MWSVIYEDELCHHGIRGQRWGVRRFQTVGGALTPAGRRRLKKKANGQFTRDKRRKSNLSDAVPAIAAVAAGTAIIAGSMAAARYGDEISTAVKTVSSTVVSRLKQSTINAGKRAAQGMVSSTKNAARYVAKNVTL